MSQGYGLRLARENVRNLSANDEPRTLLHTALALKSSRFKKPSTRSDSGVHLFIP